MRIFWFLVSSWGTHLFSFLIFPIFFKCQIWRKCRMVNVEFFSNFLSNFKRISFSDRLSSSLSTSDNQPLHSSSSRLSSPLQNFLNYHFTVHSLEVHGPNAFLMLWVVSTAQRPILNSMKKTTQIRFLSNIISLV